MKIKHPVWFLILITGALAVLSLLNTRYNPYPRIGSILLTAGWLSGSEIAVTGGKMTWLHSLKSWTAYLLPTAILVTGSLINTDLLADSPEFLVATVVSAVYIFRIIYQNRHPQKSTAEPDAKN
jgi:surface polysaccharide O-acyltransferase-like enzyme